jgi:hypothetical protein
MLAWRETRIHAIFYTQNTLVGMAAVAVVGDFFGIREMCDGKKSR